MLRILHFIAISTLVKSVDVNFLCRFLHKYSHTWREIGAALDFEKSELENINQRFHSFPQQLLTELLFKWSQWPTDDHPHAATVERLCDALRSGYVGLGAEASTLYEMRNLLPSKQRFE